MVTSKIINDPVYGFIQIPEGILLDLVNHRFFQRLSRIKQVSLGHYVYPGAHHTRFHHALGALHLMQEALTILKSKGIAITQAEHTAACIAILLHDIGHGPFSHTLENTLIGVSHEKLSLAFMEALNQEFGGKLTEAIAIFQRTHQKYFLSQLVSGQLDMDRLDYLSRDSFFTGVTEGVVGYSRIIKMLSVANGELVVEEKGIYSLEKFLIARRLMYWQVYLHKTVLAAENMLVKIIERARLLHKRNSLQLVPASFRYFMENEIKEDELIKDPLTLLYKFADLDDIDILAAIKGWQHEADRLLSFLCNALINRQLFKLKFHDSPMSMELKAKKKKQVEEWWQGNEEEIPFLIFEGKESNHAYSYSQEEIKILSKEGHVKPMSDCVDYPMPPGGIEKYYLCQVNIP
ncbi:MAG: HD domain-containing protein [Bacteroidetes bacterium]|nr:HD domain-containing protein [Bacteroidota bacterium]